MFIRKLFVGERFVEVISISNPNGITKQLCILSNAIRKFFSRSPVCQEAAHLTGTHGWMITYLSDHEGEDIFQRDLEHEFGISRSTTSKMLALMEDNGLVFREKVLSDDRLKKITLTPKARLLAKKIAEDKECTEAKLTKGFSDEELSNLASYLERMLQNISE